MSDFSTVAVFLFVVFFVVVIATLIATFVMVNTRRRKSSRSSSSSSSHKSSKCRIGPTGAQGEEGPTGATLTVGPTSTIPFSAGPVGSVGLVVIGEEDGGLAFGHGSCNGSSTTMGIPSIGQAAMALEAFTMPFDGEIGDLIVNGQIQAVNDINTLIVAIWTAPPTGGAFAPTALTISSPTVDINSPVEFESVNLIDRVPLNRGTRVVPFALAAIDGDTGVLIFRLGGTFNLFAIT